MDRPHPAPEGADDEESRRSYRPRATGFDIVQHSGELGPQRNKGEETREKITHQKFYGGEVIANVKRVCYGTYDGKKAVLVVIKLYLLGSLDVSKLRHVEVVISFRPRKESGKGSIPTVRNLSPRKVWGIPGASGRSWVLQVDRQCFVADRQPTENSPQAKTTSNKSQPRLNITGQLGSDTRHAAFHKAYWIVDEKSKEIVGIPDEMALGMIVEHDDRFQAEVKVTVDLPLHRKVLAWPWSEDDPLLFPLRESGAFIGKEPSTQQFEALSDDEWASIVSSHEFRELEKGQEKKEEPAAPKVTMKAYRVQGILAESDASSVYELIQSAFCPSGRDFDLNQRSLVDNAVYRDEKVAIITSQGLAKLVGKGDRWHHSAVPPQHGITLDLRFDGITPLAMPRSGEHLLDIIAIPGMAGHAYGSFKERNGEHMWLLDNLPADFPQSRILTFGYDSKLQESQSIQDVGGIANTLRTALKAIRPRDSAGRPNQKPIIFITHSLGGILLKQALIQMAEESDEDKTNAQSTRGILFFGVPSQGIDISATRAMVHGRANENFLLSVRPDSEFLRSQQLDFCQKFPYRSCKIISFYEGVRSPTARLGEEGWKMDGEPALSVPPSSATGGGRSWEIGPGYHFQINRDHSDMVKFHANDSWYDLVIRSCLQDIISGFAREGEAAV